MMMVRLRLWLLCLVVVLVCVSGPSLAKQSKYGRRSSTATSDFRASRGSRRSSSSSVGGSPEATEPVTVGADGEVKVGDETNAGQWNDAALKLANQGKLREALTLFQNAQAAAPNNPEYANNVGVTHMRLGNLNDARKLFKSVLKSSPGFRNAKLNLDDLESYMRANDLLDEADGGSGGAGSKYASPNQQSSSSSSSSSFSSSPASSSVAATNTEEAATLSASVGGTRPPALPASELQHHTEPLPTTTLEQLASGQFPELLTGRLPFKVTGLLETPGWANSTAFRQWSFYYFRESFHNRSADFYPHNMADEDVHPIMTNMQTAMMELVAPSGKFKTNPAFPGTYVQWNVPYSDWTRLLGEVGPLPALVDDVGTWLEACFDNDAALVNSFTHSTHWHMVLLGNPGAGMFNHWDIMGTASWQIQVKGSKLWHICSPDQAHLMGGAGAIHTFNPDYDAHPNFKTARCFYDTASAGELLFYPQNYWHQTENLGKENIALSGSLVDGNNYVGVMEEMRKDCKAKRPRFYFDPEVCSSLEESCFPWWEAAYKGAWSRRGDDSGCSVAEEEGEGEGGR